MKVFAYTSKIDVRQEVPSYLIVASNIVQAEKMIADWFKGSRWEEYYKEYYHVKEYQPTQETLLGINQEDLWRFNHNQGVDGIGFASIRSDDKPVKKGMK